MRNLESMNDVYQNNHSGAEEVLVPEDQHADPQQISKVPGNTAKTLSRKADPTKTMREVDVLVVGGGPASLGLLINAFKTNR